jgi:L-asparaginase II
VIIGSVRSGLVEAVHPVAVAAVESSGRVLAASGDVTGREFFLRSAIKPVQAAVSQRLGAGLVREQLAVAASSHSAFPVHVAYVEQMLLEVGLEAGHLRCPPDHPGATDAEVLWAQRGRHRPERIFHNCSGKHAAMLRACVANDWSLEYTAPDHPLQVAVVAAVEEAAGRPVTPTGIDGCGVPTLRCDVTGLARVFARIASAPDLAEVRGATMRYTALTRDGDRTETLIARWLPTVVKGGAMGCIGVAWVEGDVGIAAKSWTGDGAAAAVAALTVMADLGLVPPHPRAQLAGVFAPEVTGGGAPVGHLAVIER